MEIRSDRERFLILVPAVPHVLVLRRSRTGPWGSPLEGRVGAKEHLARKNQNLSRCSVPMNA